MRNKCLIEIGFRKGKITTQGIQYIKKEGNALVSTLLFQTVLICSHLYGSIYGTASSCISKD